MLDIYRRGKAIAADKRLSEAGRRRVEKLVDAVCDCTGARFSDSSVPGDEAKQDFFNLTQEIVRLLGNDELFTYVIHPQADGTNNESERTWSSEPGSRHRTNEQNPARCSPPHDHHERV